MTLELDIRSCKCSYPVEVVINGEEIRFYTLSGNEVNSCLCCGKDFKESYDIGELENTKELDHMPEVFRKLTPSQKDYIDAVFVEIIYMGVNEMDEEFKVFHSKFGRVLGGGSNE